MANSRGPTDDSMFYTAPRPDASAYYAPDWAGAAPAAVGDAQRAVAGNAEPATRSRGYRALMIGFFVVFLIYLVYLQTRTDVGENGTLRGLSDLFVLFGSAVCALMCWSTAFTLRKMQATVGNVAGRAFPFPPLTTPFTCWSIRSAGSASPC